MLDLGSHSPEHIDIVQLEKKCSYNPFGLVLRIWDDRRRIVLDEKRIVLAE